MIFWRIYNNQIISGEEVPMVGFDINKEYFLAPDEYINDNKFLIFRTCLGIGDWVMLERMAFNLKENYPTCKVYLPSPKMIKEILGPMLGNWASWGDASQTVNLMFKNNPYIDGYVDKWHTEIYHDHFRIYDSTNPKITLTQQMCKFHHIPYNKCIDVIPKLYFDKEETQEGEAYIKNYPKEFNFLHLSDRYTEKDNNILLNYMDNNKLTDKPFLIYYTGDINKTPFKDLKIIDNIEYIKNPRIQFYIKSKSQNVIGVQTGATDVVSGLTQVHSLHHSKELKNTWEVGNFIPTIKYINRKDYE